MPLRRLVYSIKETLLRFAIVAALVAGAWGILQFYSEDEIVQLAQDFWGWWSSRIGGDLAQYWNPGGAALTLGIAVLFVLSPLQRLLGRRRHGGSHFASNDHDYDDDGAAGSDE